MSQSKSSFHCGRVASRTDRYGRRAFRVVGQVGDVFAQDHLERAGHVRRRRDSVELFELGDDLREILGADGHGTVEYRPRKKGTS